MAITEKIMNLENQLIQKSRMNYDGMKICELGNQVLLNDNGKIIGIAKDHYTFLKSKHISIDLNMKDGAVGLDLGKPIPFVFVNQFDVVTNYGTVEHVKEQYQVFKNIHDMCKSDGLMIHVFPEEYKDHCRFYYSEEFINNLSRVSGYEIIDITVMNLVRPKRKLIFSGLRKSTAEDFMDYVEFNGLGVSYVDDLTSWGWRR